MALSGEPIVVPELSADTRYSLVSPTQAGLRSFTAVPLRSKDRILGVVGVASHAESRFTVEEVGLLGVIADVIGSTLDKAYLYQQVKAKEEQNARLLEESKERAELLSAISHLARVICADIDLDKGLGTFTQELKELVAFDRLCISLIEAGKVRFLAVSSTIETGLKADATCPLKDSGTGWVAKHKETLIVPDLAQERLFPLADLRFEEGLRSSIHVPLFSKGKVFGSLNLVSLKPGTYGRREQEILEQLAAQIAGAIQNTRLYSLERAESIELERQKRKQVNFIQAVTHELKTPLTSIIASGGGVG